jgi:hypothetical protein
VVVAATSSCGGDGDGWTVEVKAPLDGGGGGDHTMDPVMSVPLLVSLP